VKRQSALLQVSEAHLAILPDEDGDTPLHLSIIHENVRLTQHLVKLIVGVYMNLDIANNMRQTPLHLAIITRQPHIVQMLVQAGASVNFPDRKGNTALHLAAARRDMQVLQILARATSPVPDFNCKNFAGLAPVHLATRESSIDVLKFLFQTGANKNAMDACSGRTPLHYAVEAENFILVNFLLESGCNVNSATFSGNTPLHIAAGRRLKEIVALLMAYGANPALANGEGDFPTDLPASLLMQRARMNAH
jgi:ankyrin repeat protein